MKRDSYLLSINFKVILKNLHDWGWTDTQIANETGIYRTTVSKLRNGKHDSLLFNKGYALLQLYEDEMIGRAKPSRKAHLIKERLTRA